MRTTARHSPPLAKLFGFDFFISYKRSEASAYAEELHRQLSSAGYVCFIDREETPAGIRITPAIKRALRRSRFLLVILTPGVAQSAWVVQETVAFEQRSGALIPINVGGFLNSGACKDSPLAWLRDFAWLDETVPAVTDGVPSAALIAEIGKAHTGRRVRARAAAILGAFVCAVLAGSITFAYVARQNARNSAASRAQFLARQAMSDAQPARQRLDYALEAVSLATDSDADIQSTAEQALLHSAFALGGVQLFPGSSRDHFAADFFLRGQVQQHKHLLAVAIGGEREEWIRIWDFTRFALPDFKTSSTLDTDGLVQSMAISPDAQHIAAITTSNELLVWQVRDGENIAPKFRQPLPRSWINPELHWTQNSSVKLATNYGFVDIGQGGATLKLFPQQSRLAVSEDGRWVFSWTSDVDLNDAQKPRKSVGKLWDTSKDVVAIQDLVFEAKFDLKQVRFSPDGCHVAFVPGQSNVSAVRLAKLPCREGDPRSVEVYEVEAGGPPEMHSYDTVQDVVFNPDGRHALMFGTHMGAQLIPLDGSQSGRVLDGHHFSQANGFGGSIGFSRTIAAAFSSDGAWLATVGREILLWDLKATDPSAPPRRRLDIGVQEINRIQFSPDGRFVLAGGPPFRLWDLHVPDGAIAPILIDSATAVGEYADSRAFLSSDGHWLLEFSIRSMSTSHTDVSGRAWPLLLPTLRQLATGADSERRAAK